MNIINRLVQYSYKHKLTHVPSALSMLTYIDTIFTNKLIVPYRDRIILGKPFGSQAYYLTWRGLGYIDDIEALSVGVKHSEIDFVDYGEETMGNALGVATGIAIANPDQTVWVNITDATLQMGSTLEAIQYIGHNNIKNVIMTIDNNDCQVTGRTSNVISTTPVIDFIYNNRWSVTECPGHNPQAILDMYPTITLNPRAIIYNTTKGYGVPYMEQDPITWHYKHIEHV